jgi:hypothetical protein
VTGVQFGGVYLDAGEWAEVEVLRDFYRDALGMEVHSPASTAGA